MKETPPSSCKAFEISGKLIDNNRDIANSFCEFLYHRLQSCVNYYLINSSGKIPAISSKRLIDSIFDQSLGQKFFAILII